MDYYPCISHDQRNLELQKQAVDLCARFNSIPLNNIAALNLESSPIEIDQEFAAGAYKDWKEVLNQHKGRFDEALLDEIYQNLDIVCPILNSEPHYLCHGDFHPENLLFDGKQLYICDWQNVSIGKCIGDISFFLSRGMGMGINMNADQLLDYYCERLSTYTGYHIDKVTLLKEKYASNVLCTFSFWANYLKDSTYEGVASHFNEMVKEYNYIIS